MRILLLHPEDSPRRGPWSGERWDLVVDLGNSSEFSTAAAMQQFGCPIIRSNSFCNGVEDVKQVREILSPGYGRLVDEEGIDWWNLTALLIEGQLTALLTLRRVAAQINGKPDLWATRAGWPANALGVLLRRELKTFYANVPAYFVRRIVHYRRLWHRFSAAQIKEIFLDKYDPAYKWRSRFAVKTKTAGDAVVLVPSAYENASRMAAGYARLIPDQNFLLVATRRSGKQFDPPPNMHVSDLASYATNAERKPSEGAALLRAWSRLKPELCATPEFEVLSRIGALDEFPHWLCNGLGIRDAWREVLQQENVSAVLCGDDSNLYTRLPVSLASQRKIPTVDFHHGALDGRYLLKDLPSDAYLAKNAMERDYLLRVCGLPAERIITAAPYPAYTAQHKTRPFSSRSSIILFSEPYENADMRAEEVYREILPPLCALARAHDCRLVLKLHPFESPKDRHQIARDLLSGEDFKQIRILDGPLSEQLLASAWFGVTIESTTVLDCVAYGVPCFLMGWLRLSPYEYAQQYARFGLGEVLHSVHEFPQIPARLAKFTPRETKQECLWSIANPETLRNLFGTRPLPELVARRVS